MKITKDMTLNKKKSVVITLIIILAVIISVGVYVSVVSYNNSNRVLNSGFTVAQKLKSIEIYTGFEDSIKDSEFDSYLGLNAVGLNVVQCAMRLTGAKNIAGLPSDVMNTFNTVNYWKTILPDNYNTDETIYSPANSDDQKLSPISSANTYRVYMNVLGYNSADYGSTDSDVISFATSLGYGLMLTPVATDTITNGELSLIIYETLFLKCKATQTALYRTLILLDSDIENKMNELLMIDNFPDYLPVFNGGINSDESFNSFESTDSVTGNPKSEWNASFSNTSMTDYNNYKNLLVQHNWALEGEYNQTNDTGTFQMAFYYCTIGSFEADCIIKYYPATGITILWLGYGAPL